MAMRELCFRGKRLDNGDWISSGSIIQCDNHMFYIPMKDRKAWVCVDDAGNITQMDDVLFYIVDPETFGQYTGLTDKGGQRIFEGDILRMDNFTPNICEVRFIEGAFCLMFPGVDFPTDIHYIHHAEIPSATVIGNIHDNPELMRHE